MTKIFILFFISSTSILVLFQNCSKSTFDSNPNVTVQSSMITPVVEEFITTSMLLGGGPYQYSYKIMSDGSVLLKEDNGNNFLVATLSSTALNYVKNMARQISLANPTMINNNQFICMDAPNFQYFVYGANDLKVKFSENTGCETIYISDPLAFDLKNIMDGFSLLQTNAAAVSGFIDGSKVLFKSRTYGGMIFTPDSGIKVYYNGIIEKYGNTGTTQIGQLSAAVLGNYINYIASLNVVPPLTDINSGEPICFDAPTTDFTMYKTNNVEVLLVRKQNCHTNILNDVIPYSVFQFLNGLNTF